MSKEKPIDIEAMKREFNSKAHIYNQLRDEALYILEPALKNAQIKLHYISHRIKQVESFIGKVQRKQYAKPFEEIHDIVGLRVVCLFLSDIERIATLIRDSFTVLEEDNKIEGGEVSSFGYMSVHFIATMKKEHIGPRYDPIAKLQFEIQVRTIAMDAWANVSHHLDYKSDKDVPSELRKDFYALSGLFYVADRHFEMFYNVSKQSQTNMAELFAAATSTEAKDEQEINLDSLRAYLNTKFPDRRHSPSEIISGLVDQLLKAGYKSIGEVDRMVDSASEAVELYEAESTEAALGIKIADTGIVRASANIASDKFLRIHSERSARRTPVETFYKQQQAKFGKYRKLLK